LPSFPLWQGGFSGEHCGQAKSKVADGIDDPTWLHHLRRKDYRWLLEVIKDEALAVEAAEIEGFSGITAKKSRLLMKAAVERLYTLPDKSSKLIPGHGAPEKASNDGPSSREQRKGRPEA
jgi:hypothetical protein